MNGRIRRGIEEHRAGDRGFFQTARVMGADTDVSGNERRPTPEDDVREALMKFDPLWDQLNTWEQERFIRTLVKEVRYDGPSQTVTIGFLSEGIKELCQPTGFVKEGIP